MARIPSRAERLKEAVRRMETTWEADQYAECRAALTDILALAPDYPEAYLKRAIILAHMHRHEEAIPDFREALRRKDPDDANTWTWLGHMLYLTDDEAGAVRAFSRAIKTDPTDASAYLFRAKRLLETKPKAALRDLTKAIALAPNKIEPYELRGHLRRKEAPAAAHADFLQAIRLGSEDPDTFFFAAHYAVENDDWPVTEDVCATGLQKFPQDQWLNYYQGRCLVEAEKYEEALPHLAVAAAASPDASAFLYFHAHCLWRLERYEESIPLYDRTLALAGEDEDAYYERGDCHYQLDHYQEAVEDLTASLRANPDDLSVLDLRAQALTGLGRPQDALEDIRRLLADDPEPRHYRDTLVEVLEALGEFEPAIHEALKLIAEDPADARPYFQWAHCLYTMGEFEDSLDVCDQALDRGWDEYSVVALMGLCHQSRGDSENALTCLRRAEALDPCSSNLALQAQALMNLGEYEEARQALEQELAVDPASWTAYCRRAQIWLEYDEFDRALEGFAKAVAIAPKEPDPRRLRIPVHETLDDYRGVIADLDALVELEPGLSNHYWWRAHYWDELGETARADADAATAERLDHEAENGPEDGDVISEEKMKIWATIQEHFGGVKLAEITLTERHFPVQVGADLQKAIECLADTGAEAVEFWTVRQCNSPVTNFPDAYEKNRRNPPLAGPPSYVEIDVGEEDPVRALRDGLWLLRVGGTAVAMILDTTSVHRSIRFQLAVPTASGPAAATRLFKHLEDTVKKSPCYRGKVLSLEYREMYSGQNQGLRVHRLRGVPRQDVILPPATLELLDRNVGRFIQHRPQLAEMGLMAKKGLLFHGPPGTGKTHTIHYLAQVVADQTTFLIAANQVAVLDEYMTLARLYQPSLVVIEDVDLIAREREAMRSAGEEMLLNKLLNEMDGLQIDAQVMFILTTNRPEALEAALASRPGRIDQAIEFPLPDAAGRGKLARLYCGKFRLADAVVKKVVARTEGLTASLIKELMRRAAQFALERGDRKQLNEHDVDTAIEELLLLNGKLNRRLLGFGEPVNGILG